MMNCYVIAEAGVNHNGSEELAFKLIDCAADCGADAIKFQTFRADSLVSKGTATAEYQQQATGETDQYEMLKRLELSEELHCELFKYCETRNIEFLSTPFDIESARFLISLGMKRIKISSGELTNLPYLTELAKLKVPLILSTGMATLDEVADAVDAVKDVWKNVAFEGDLQDQLTILHCTSNYPTADSDVNLLAMSTIREEFDLPTGYSDHTAGILISMAAVCMGATVIEKHFTLDRELPGPDHQASLEPQELTSMINNIRRIEVCMGNGDKRPQASEVPVRNLVRRSITINTDLSAGEIVKKEDVIFLRPGTGIAPKYYDKIVGRTLNSDFKAGSQPLWKDFD